MLKDIIGEALIELSQLNYVLNTDIENIRNSTVSEIKAEVRKMLPDEKAKPDENDTCISCKKHIDICNCELNFTWNDCRAEMSNAVERME